MTSADVQTELDAAVTALQHTTTSYPDMVKRYGADPAKWPPTSNWHIAFAHIAAARTEAGQLVTPAPPTAAFTFKEA